MSRKEDPFEECRGPMDEPIWPERLTARVVSPGRPPRIRGYDVEGDLAGHYSFAEVVLAALCGEAPDRAAGRAFEIALVWLSPLSAAHAPVHAAGLARLCGADTTGVAGVAAIGLAELARKVAAEHAELLSWLDEARGDPPDGFAPADDEDRRRSDLFRAQIGNAGLELPGAELSPTALALCVLHRCGLRSREPIEAALVVARLPCAAAEALEVPPLRFDQYPINLPRFRYVEDG